MVINIKKVRLISRFSILGIIAEVMKMWYVIQTFSGEEDRTADIIRRMVPLDCFEECFVLKRERLYCLLMEL